MADMLAIVKRTVFEQWAGDMDVGAVLSWDDYESAAPRLSRLTKRSRLFLVTVRPPDERLWLVAVYKGLRRTSKGWRAARPNSTPITDITRLRSKLKFDNGKGMTSASGLLGNSLQVPRILTERDVALLEAALRASADRNNHSDTASEPDEDAEWFEVSNLDPEALRHLYPPEGVLTLVYSIGPMVRDYDYRYEDARSLLADLVNGARDADIDEFRRFEFDVWIGQTCAFGHYVEEMFVTLAARAQLPVKLLRRCAPNRRLLRVETGRHPIVDGGFPEVKIANGTIAGTWPTKGDTYLVFSRMYKSAHGLAPETRDPYRQMVHGAPEPAHFTWLSQTDRLKRRAVEVVSNESLVADRIPADDARSQLISFGLTLDPIEFAGSLEGAYVAAERVFDALLEGANLSSVPLGELRTWLFWETQKMRQGDDLDEGHLVQVLAELRRRCDRGAPVADPGGGKTPPTAS